MAAEKIDSAEDYNVDIPFSYSIKQRIHKKSTDDSKSTDVKEISIIYCQSRLKNGKICTKRANTKLTFLNENDQPQTQNVCGTHSNVILSKSKDNPDDYKQLKTEPIKKSKPKVVRLKLIDLIDEKVKDKNQCCVRLGLNQPLCNNIAFYKIKGKYFCANHSKKHPNAEEAINTDKVDFQDKNFHKLAIILNKLDDRLSKIETDTDRIKGLFEIMCNQPNFREQVYAISEGKQSDLLKEDKINKINPLI